MWSVIGFDQQKKLFEHLLKQGRLAHAYLFTGPDMIGKKRFAYDIHRQTLTEHVGLVQADLLSVAPQVSEGESKIYIDDVRGIGPFLSRKPLVGTHAFVVIDAADRMTIEAANALLKILEEPPAYAVLILITSQPGLLPATIVSRCQEIAFLPHPSEMIDQVLTDRRIGADDRELLRMMAAGRLGWVLQTIESNNIASVRTAIKEFDLMTRQGIADRLVYAKKLADRDDYPSTVHYWLRWAHAHLTTLPPTLIRGLLQLHHLLSQPQYNHRLALEQFLVNL